MEVGQSVTPDSQFLYTGKHAHDIFIVNGHGISLTMKVSLDMLLITIYRYTDAHTTKTLKSKLYHLL